MIAQKSSYYTLMISLMGLLAAIVVMMAVENMAMARILSFIAGSITLIYYLINLYLARKN